MSATNIPSAYRIANIDPNDALILAHNANPRRITFSERTAVRRHPRHLQCIGDRRGIIDLLLHRRTEHRFGRDGLVAAHKVAFDRAAWGCHCRIYRIETLMSY